MSEKFDPAMLAAHSAKSMAIEELLEGASVEQVRWRLRSYGRTNAEIAWGLAEAQPLSGGQSRR